MAQDETSGQGASSDALVAAAERLDELSDEALQELLEESRIIIRPGGQVVFENLTADLLDVAHTLDPDNANIQCRIDAVAPMGADDAASDSRTDKDAGSQGEEA